MPSVAALLDDTTFPYVWLDDTYLRARREHRIVSRAVVVAAAVAADGKREVLELARLGTPKTKSSGPSSSAASTTGGSPERSWFPDAHAGLKDATDQNDHPRR